MPSPKLVYVIDCSVTNIPTSGYVVIVPNSPVAVSQVQFVYFNPSGNSALVKLAVGPIGSEQDIMVNSVYAASDFSCYQQSGTTFSVQAVGAPITSGFLAVSLLYA